MANPALIRTTRRWLLVPLAAESDDLAVFQVRPFLATDERVEGVRRIMSDSVLDLGGVVEFLSGGTK